MLLQLLLCAATWCEQIFILKSLLDRRIGDLFPPINTNYQENKKLEGLKGKLESVAVRNKTSSEQASKVPPYKGITPFLTLSRGPPGITFH